MKNNFKSFLFIIISGILINLFCVFLFFVPVHAESYFPMSQNNNGKFSEGLLNNIDSRFDAENNYIFVHYSGYNGNAGYGTHYYNVIYFPKSSSGYLFGEINSNGYQFSLNPSGTTNFLQGSFTNDNRDRSAINGLSVNGNYANWFYNLNSNIYSSSIDYVSNFRLYTANIDNRQVVLNYGAGEVDDSIFQGHATPPDPYEEPILAQGSNYTLPREVPEAPIVNNYTWVTYSPPSVDNSTLENLVESLVDIVKYNASYISTNISNEFNTLIGVIKDSGNYIVKTIQYYVGLVNDNIKNGFTNLYDNIVSLFEPAINFVVDSFNYIFEPLDTSAVSSALQSTSYYGLVTSATSFKTTYSNFFDSIQQVNSLSFSVPYTILSSSGYILVDFSWYDDIRSSVVPWIVGFLYAGFGLAIFRSIPSIIHGVSGVLQKGG